MAKEESKNILKHYRPYVKRRRRLYKNWCKRWYQGHWTPDYRFGSNTDCQDVKTWGSQTLRHHRYSEPESFVPFYLSWRGLQCLLPVIGPRANWTWTLPILARPLRGLIHVALPFNRRTDSTHHSLVFGVTSTFGPLISIVTQTFAPVLCQIIIEKNGWFTGSCGPAHGYPALKSDPDRSSPKAPSSHRAAEESTHSAGAQLLGGPQ